MGVGGGQTRQHFMKIKSGPVFTPWLQLQLLLWMWTGYYRYRRENVIELIEFKRFITHVEALCLGLEQLPLF